jgi:hypothetical protein
VLPVSDPVVPLPVVPEPVLPVSDPVVPVTPVSAPVVPVLVVDVGLAILLSQAVSDSVEIVAATRIIGREIFIFAV